MAILPGEPGLASSPRLSLNTFSLTPCTSQTAEKTATKEEEWKESTFYEG